MNKEERLEHLLNFILETKYDTLDEKVQKHALKCFFDLSCVIAAGAKNHTTKTITGYVEGNYPEGEVTVLSTGRSSNLIGASLANGMAANALDLDDGYSLLRGHPGSGFFGALLSASDLVNCTYGEFLAALVVAYETSIREGYAIRDFYGWDHSSGSYSAFGAAASIGKLLGLSCHELEMALGIADFLLPVVPAKRSCYVPSMNKDGIYFGQHVGAQAVLMARAGMTGKNPIILDDKYANYIDSLGSKFYMFDLYIKFFSCCRWVHSPIGAVAGLMKDNKLEAEDIARVDVYSFGNAGTLYKKAPTCEDEAQYNIIYPIAAQIVFGKVGPIESSTAKMLDERIAPTMKKIEFHHEPEYDKVFPGKRLSHVVITTFDGRVLKSPALEPRGDHNADVSIPELVEKAFIINGSYSKHSTIELFVNAVLNTDPCEPFSKVYKTIKNLATENIHPNLSFI